jgi:hypothetical protein
MNSQGLDRVFAASGELAVSGGFKPSFKTQATSGQIAVNQCLWRQPS